MTKSVMSRLVVASIIVSLVGLGGAEASLKRQSRQGSPVSAIRQQPSRTTASLWTRLQKNCRLPLYTNHPVVQAEINTYTKHPKALEKMLGRSSPYLYLVVDAIERHGLPAELALLPFVESGFVPSAESNPGARGLWQLMPATGKAYGLIIQPDYDGAQDVVASTETALKYLSYLYERFDGDWLLALAAYNAGEGRVKRLIKANHAKGKRTDFFALNLPKETKRYVPKLLAMANIIKQPMHYQVRLPTMVNRPILAQVDVGPNVNLSHVAWLTGLSVTDLEQWNTAYRYGSTPSQGPSKVLLPIREADILVRKRSLLAHAPIQKNTYVVRRGDSLSVIAKRFRTDLNSLKKLNHLRGDTIKVGQTLALPPSRLATNQAPNKQVHVVKVGDSLWSIGNEYSVSVALLAKWNQLNVNKPLQPGQKITIMVT